MEDNTCTHCNPHISNPSHIFERVVNTLFPLATLFRPIERLLHVSPRLHRATNKAITRGFVRTLLMFRIFKEIDVKDSDEDIHSRSLIIVKEAKGRNIPIKALKLFGKTETGLFSMEVNGNKKIFEGLPYVDIEDISYVGFGDKWNLKSLLRKKGLPYPEGGVFQNHKQALRYTEENIGFPVVVKPRSGSLSRHTMCNITTDRGLREAIRVAKLISREFIVEEFIPGGVHRITLVDGKIVASCLREPPNVIGDGEHTVQELTNIKNKDPRRGHAHQKNFTLHKIQLDRRARMLLLQQGISIETVVPRGKKIYLHDKVTLSAGADIHDTTDMIHEDNSSLFRSVYDVCDAPVIGIDFIVKDISQSHYTQRCAIIEVNSLPYIDMHHYPVTGRPRNVAGDILDYCVSRW